MNIHRNLSFTRTLATAGSVALLLAGQAYAQGNNNTSQLDPTREGAQSSAELPAGEFERDVSQLDVDAWEQDFRRIDENENNAAEWDEIESAYEEQLTEADIDREEAFNRFDQNSDGAIDQAEYWFLLTGIEAELSGEQQQAQQAQSQQQQSGQMAAGSAGQQDRQQTQQTPQQQGEQLAAENLQDKPLVNEQGDELGTIQDVVVNQNSEQQALVVSVGGFLGVGAREVVLQADEVTVENDQVVWQSGNDKDSLKQMPEYNEQNYISAR